MPEILTDAYLLFTFVFKQALKLTSSPRATSMKTTRVTILNLQRLTFGMLTNV